MKIKIFFILLLLSLSNILQAQIFNYNLKKIQKSNKKAAKRDLIWREGIGLEEKFIWNRQYSKHLEYLPISSFFLSPKSLKYDSTKNITDFLIFNKKKPIQDYFTFKNGKFEGVKSLFNNVYYDSKGFVSGYDSSKVFEPNHYNTVMYNSLNILKEHNFTFLFSVKYFRNSIWFIENNKVYLLDTTELKIYEPDTYIKQKCSIGTIHKLSQNILNEFCD